MARECLRCGSSFEAARPTKRYCSERCRKRAEVTRWSEGRARVRTYRARERAPRPCGNCGAEFVPGNTLGRYCSPRCKDAGKPSARALSCASCGRPMARSGTSRPQGEATCTACILAAAPGNLRARRQRGRQARRAALAAVESEPYTLADIAGRDGWDCWLCGEGVDPEARWPDRQCASVDHVVPLSLGGPDVLANVRLAHWYCNTLRGVRPAGLVASGG